MAEDVFISYARSDLDAATAVRLVLERNGISCWMDVEGIQSGEAFGVEIQTAIEACQVVVFILSERSQQSQWVRKEITCALNCGKPVLPIAIEKCDIVAPFSFYFSDVQRGIVYQDIAQSLDGLVRDVRSLMHEEEKSGQPVIPKEAVSALSPAHASRNVAAGVGMGVAATAVIVALVLGRGLTGPRVDTASNTTPIESARTQLAAQVYASDCFSYMMAGGIDTTDYLGFYARTVGQEDSPAVSIYKAFSILSFVRNQGDAAAQVESVSLEVLDLEEIKVPVVKADTALNNQSLTVFVANDGWGDADEVSPDIYFTSLTEDARIAIGEVMPSYETAPVTGLAPGEVAKLVSGEVDLDCLAELGKTPDANSSRLYLHIDDANTGEQLYLGWLVLDSEGLRLACDSFGLGDYSVTLFAILDVDAHPSSIRFTGEDATPRVEDTFRIETVIAPTKSCRLSCKDVYSVNGDLQETPEYELLVTVPVFESGAFGYGGELTRELAANPTMDSFRMQELAAAYRYDPTSVKEQAR